jgi:hypothetical protein
MFMLPPCPGEGDLERIKRRPANWWRLFMEGWEFLPENRRWDAEEREWISRATGLHQLSPSEWANGEPDDWWKTLASEYARGASLSDALIAAEEFRGDW